MFMMEFWFLETVLGVWFAFWTVPMPWPLTGGYRWQQPYIPEFWWRGKERDFEWGWTLSSKSCIVCTFQKAIFIFIVLFCFHVCLLVYTKSFNFFLPLNWGCPLIGPTNWVRMRQAFFRSSLLDPSLFRASRKGCLVAWGELLGCLSLLTSKWPCYPRPLTCRVISATSAPSSTCHFCHAPLLQVFISCLHSVSVKWGPAHAHQSHSLGLGRFTVAQQVERL